jgi:hypothetical protein
MYCQLEGGEFCNAALGHDLRCIASPQPYCRPVSAGYGAVMNQYAGLNEDCDATNQRGPCWPCTSSNPHGYFEMPSNMVDGVFNCDPDADDYLATFSESFDTTDLAAYPGKDWYKRNCFAYNSAMPKDVVGFYPFWRPGAHGDILDCAHAFSNVQSKSGKPDNYPAAYQMSSRYGNEDAFNELAGGDTLAGYAFNTAQSYASILNKGYTPYYPHRARMSPFYHQGWFWSSTSDPQHEEVPASLGSDVNELILYNFQPLYGRWAFPHTNREFLDPSSYSSGTLDETITTLTTTETVRAAYPLGSSPTWGSVVFDKTADDDSYTLINNLVAGDARPAGTSDGEGRANFIPSTNSAAKERQNIVSSGWTSTINIAMTATGCDATETMPTITDATDSNGNKMFFKLGKTMYKQTFVSTRYYASLTGGIGGSTYAGVGGSDESNNPVSSCSGTTSSTCISKTTALFNYPFIMTYDGGDLTEPDATQDGLAYDASINKFYPLDGAEDCSSTKNSLRHTAVNIFSRMSQKEALHHAQGAFWMCIVVVQWADLLICKTRWLSIRDQGMSNSAMNFGLFFETLLAAYLAYMPVLCQAFGTRDIRVTHWFTAMPFSMMIFGYDETRKYLMRATSPVTIDKGTGQSLRTAGWLERNTYY